METETDRGTKTVTRTKSFRELRARIDADPRRRERVEAQTQALLAVVKLAELREARQATQQELAQALEMTQANVSRIEHEDDIYLSTLRRYVEALGGQLEVHAVFPDETVKVAV
jgi:DNA-binding Xre family transcriptional regulator